MAEIAAFCRQRCMTCLPLSRAEAARRGWNELDVVLITGDAYVDHPAFGAAVIAS